MRIASKRAGEGVLGPEYPAGYPGGAAMGHENYSISGMVFGRGIGAYAAHGAHYKATRPPVFGLCAGPL